MRTRELMTDEEKQKLKKTKAKESNQVSYDDRKKCRSLNEFFEGD